MRRNEPLSLPEEIMLLALHDEKGTVALESRYPYAVGGAVLAELLMLERVRLSESGRKRVVTVVSSTPTGRPFLDDCLAQIADERKARPADFWVSRFAQTKQLKHRLAYQLVDRGILRADEDKILLLFTRRVYPEVDSRPEKELVARLKRAIFTNGDVDPRTAVLVSLSHHADLLPNAFDKKKLKGRRKRIERIGNGDASTEATKKAIKAMEAAVFVACVMPAVMVATTWS